MREPGRVAAAIEILDDIFAGKPAEQALTNWARQNRYAGSKDRAAIRDIVFDCLRNMRSFGHFGGGQSGRAVAIGWARSQGLDVSTIFSSEKFAPEQLSADEQAVDAKAPFPSEPIEFDYPDWLEPDLKSSLGTALPAVMTHLKTRAPIDLRVNTAKTSRSAAQKSLHSEGIETIPVEIANTALRVTHETRKVPQSNAFLSGEIELQDAGAQVICHRLPQGAQTVLDYCAGGGGKSLTYAALNQASKISAFDISQKRLEQLQPRLDRAGTVAELCKTDPATAKKRFDLVILDVPCSGTGSWRRSVDAKWRFTRERLDALCTLQFVILQKLAPKVSDNGHLAYITCSFLQQENQSQIDRFLRENANWTVTDSMQLLPSEQSDGFYFALLKKQL